MRHTRGVVLGVGGLWLMWLGSCDTIAPPPPPPPGTLTISDSATTDVPPSPALHRLPTGMAAAVATQTTGAETEVAYISLSPESYPEGALARIRNTRIAGTLAAAVMDGGFDPVAVPATADDSVEIEILGSTGVMVARTGSKVPKRRRPRVVRTVPPRGKTDVAVNAVIVVIFSEPVASGSLTPSSVRLFEGTTTVAGTARLVEGTTTAVTFQPSRPLAGNTSYRLVVTQEARDLDGDPLETPVNIEFRTRATGSVASLTMTPEVVTAHAGTGLLFRLTPVLRDAQGRTLTGIPVEWSSSDTTIAVIGAASWDGIHPLAYIGGRGVPGSVTITAIAQGYGDTATVTLENLADIQLASISTGSVDRFCVLSVDGRPYCRGEGFGAEVPVAVPGGLTFTKISVGRNHACALSTDGTAYCWGRNSAGQLGAATIEVCSPYEPDLNDSCRPLRVSGGLSFTDITTGRSHTCGLTTLGAAYCWGDGRAGQFGAYPGWKSAAPVAVAPEHRFRRIDSGKAHTCGLTDAGTVYCWGGPYRTDSASWEPVAVAPGLVFSELTVGGDNSIAGFPDHACGLTDAGAVYCWDAAPPSQVAPRAITLPSGVTLKTIDAGLGHTCGVATEGSVYCWGWKYQESDYVAFDPIRVNDRRFLSVSSGGGGFDGFEGRACGVGEDGRAYCWDPAVGQPWRAIP